MTKDCSAGVLHRAIFAGGGTGGHLYPGLAVAELLRQEGCEVSFVGTTHGLGAKILPPLGYPLDFIHNVPGVVIYRHIRPLHAPRAASIPSDSLIQA